MKETLKTEGTKVTGKVMESLDLDNEVNKGQMKRVTDDFKSSLETLTSASPSPSVWSGCGCILYQPCWTPRLIAKRWHSHI